MPTNWSEIAKKAGKETDKQFARQIAGLTSLNDSEIEKIIFETGISQKDLAEILKQVKDSSISNEEKAKAIQNINKGLNVLIELAARLL